MIDYHLLCLEILEDQMAVMVALKKIGGKDFLQLLKRMKRERQWLKKWVEKEQKCRGESSTEAHLRRPVLLGLGRGNNPRSHLLPFRNSEWLDAQAHRQKKYRIIVGLVAVAILAAIGGGRALILLSRNTQKRLTDILPCLL